MLRLLSIVLILLKPLTNAEQIWSWTCDNTEGFCTRQYTSTLSEEVSYKTLELCRIVCGKYSALWPRPTHSAQFGNQLYIFNPRDVSFIISAENGAEEYMKIVTENFKDILLGEASCQNSLSIKIELNIIIDSPDVVLNLKTDESYKLHLTDTVTNGPEVKISASTVFGARHALETLSQLTSPYPMEDGTFCTAIINEAVVHDAPKYSYRGLLLDTSRNFLTIGNIEKHIDGMAASKLNVLHWHITDSHSFPFESKRVPNMTKYGAYSAEKIYTTSNIEYIIDYAIHKGVRVILEIDAPSHSGNGWNWGPDAGLGQLTVCYQQEPWRDFCVQPPCGQLNPVNNNVYKILKDLYADVYDLLPDMDIMHMGGDELFIPCWNSTEEIIKYLDGKPRDLNTFLDLWSSFQSKALNALDQVTSNNDIQVVLWTSHLTDPEVIKKYLSTDRYIIQTWVPNTETLPQDLLKLGYKLIISTKNAWYLDHGFWGSTTYYDWKTVYSNRILDDKNVLGGEVCMWGEYADDNNIESKTWPRAAAAAESLWSLPTTFVEAAPRFHRHRERLVSRGIRADAVVPKWCYQNEGQC